MADNIRQNLATFPPTYDPNFNGVTGVNQKIYPVSSVISGGKISGNLEFVYTVPSGYRQDNSKTFIVHEVAFGSTGALTTPPTMSAIAPNVCSTFYSTVRLELNDYLASMSSQCPQDDTMFKRMINSSVKNATINSIGLFGGSDNSRFASGAVFHKTLAWRPDMCINHEQVFPENLRVHLTLTVNPNLHTPAVSPAFVNKTNNASTGELTFFNIYLMVNFVKIETPTPSLVFIPAYNVKSTFIDVSNNSDQNLQITIPRESYKVITGLQSTLTSVLGGQAVTKFSSGSGFGAQNAYSKFLQNYQLRYAGQTYPAAPYNVNEATAGYSTSGEMFCDYLGAVDASFDSAGAESYDQWSDPVNLDSVGQGRLIAHNVVKPSNDYDANAELTLHFSTAPTTTRAVVFAISKNALGVQYGPNKTIERVAVMPYA